MSHQNEAFGFYWRCSFLRSLVDIPFEGVGVTVCRMCKYVNSMKYSRVTLFLTKSCGILVQTRRRGAVVQLFATVTYPWRAKDNTFLRRPTLFFSSSSAKNEITMSQSRMFSPRLQRTTAPQFCEP